jgi:hypothetical protein
MTDTVALPTVDLDETAVPQAVVAARELSRRYGEGDAAVDGHGRRSEWRAS